MKGKIEKKYMMTKIIYYYKTANKLYDRIITINPINLPAYLFSKIESLEENLSIIILVNEEKKVFLGIITIREIKKDEILNLNNNIIINQDLN